MTCPRSASLSRLPAVAALLTTVAEASFDASLSTFRPTPGLTRSTTSITVGRRAMRPANATSRCDDRVNDKTTSKRRAILTIRGMERSPPTAHRTAGPAGTARAIGSTDPTVRRQVERKVRQPTPFPVIAQRALRSTGEREDDTACGERAGEVDQPQLSTPDLRGLREHHDRDVVGARRHRTG